MSFRRVKYKDVEIGKGFQWDILDEAGKLLLRKGAIIQNSRQADLVLTRGMYYVDDYKEACKSPFGPEDYHDISPFDLIDEVQTKLKLYLNNLDKEKDLSGKISELCRIIQYSCRKDPDATLSTILLASNELYSIRHQVHVAIICEVISRAMDISEELRHSLLAAAMTHNIGMLKLQEELYAQEEPLSDEQIQMVRSHPFSGAEILVRHGVTDQNWVEAVKQHHEGIDGNGYPQGLKADHILAIARLISISDFFCAKVSGRLYRPALTTFKAMQVVFSADDGRIDSHIASLFVKLLGIYLPGTFVRLANGEIGIVTRRGEKAHCPIVFGIMGPHEKLLQSPVRRDCSQSEYQIKEVIVPGKMDLKIDKYAIWNYRRFIKPKE